MRRRWLTGWVGCLGSVALAGLLVACGGGNEQTGPTDLYGAYEVVEAGMSEAQVKLIAGGEPLRRQADGAQVTVLTWEADPNTYRHVALHVSVHKSDGVTRKLVLGYRGNKSQSY